MTTPPLPPPLAVVFTLLFFCKYLEVVVNYLEINFEIAKALLMHSLVVVVVVVF